MLIFVSSSLKRITATALTRHFNFPLSHPLFLKLKLLPVSSFTMSSTSIKTHSTLPHVLILKVTIWIDPSNIEEFFSYFTPAYDACMAEPECVFFIVGQNPQVPGEIWWCEGWNQDVEWLQKVRSFWRFSGLDAWKAKSRKEEMNVGESICGRDRKCDWAFKP